MSEIALEFEVNGGMSMTLELLSTYYPSLSDISSDKIGLIVESGYFGSNPFFIKKYLDAHKFKHEQTESLSELQSCVKPGRVFIMSCWNDKNDIGGGLHTIAAWVDSDGSINTYNNGKNNKFGDFYDLINSSDRAYITGYYLC